MFSGIHKTLALIKSTGIYSSANQQMMALANSIGKNSLAEQLIKSDVGRVSKLIHSGFYSSAPYKANLLSKVLQDQPYQLAIQSVMAGIGKVQKQKYFTDLIGQNERFGSLFYKQNQFIGLINNLAPVFESKVYSQQVRSLAAIYTKSAINAGLGAAILEEEETLNLVDEVTDRLTETVSEIYQRGFYTADDIANLLGFLAKHKEWAFFIIGLILQFLSWRYPYNPTPSDADVITQQNNQAVIDTLHNNYNSKAISKKVNTDVSLRADASIKSKSLGIVSAGTTVFIYDVEADWAFINYWDENRKCFVSSWMSTKYFAKETFSKKFKKRIKSNHLVKN